MTAHQMTFAMHNHNSTLSPFDESITIPPHTPISQIESSKKHFPEDGYRHHHTPQTKSSLENNKTYFYSVHNDNDDEQDKNLEKTARRLEYDHKEKYQNEKTKNHLHLLPLLSVPALPLSNSNISDTNSPIIPDQRFLQESFRHEKTENKPAVLHVLSKEELDNVLPYEITELEKPHLNSLLQLFNKKNWIKIGSLNIEDIISESFLKVPQDELLFHLNTCYKFLALKDAENNYMGWLIYTISEEDGQPYITIDLCAASKNLNSEKIKALHEKLKEVSSLLECKKIIANPLTDKEKKFYSEKLGYSNDGDAFFIMKK